LVKIRLHTKNQLLRLSGSALKVPLLSQAPTPVEVELVTITNISLLVAQCPECWFTSLVAQGLIPGMSHSESTITRGKTQNDAAATYLIFVNYILLQILGNVMKKENLRMGKTHGPVSALNTKKQKQKKHKYCF
jgi:hypothetical protein